jgi:clan AA aspartic protease (TIGR02281 family)
MAGRWDEQKKELAAKEKEFAAQRDKRFNDAYDDWMRDEREKKSKASDSRNVKVAKDENGRHIIVDALINDKVKASLLLDTGASIVLLSKRIGDELGIDTSNTKEVISLKLADGTAAAAKAVMLESVQIQDVKCEKVMAAVLTEQSPGNGLRDGLLGMSFLGRFNMSIDLKTMTMKLDRLENRQ